MMHCESLFSLESGCHVHLVENRMCSGNERKEIKPSTNTKRDDQVNEENKVIDPTHKDS